MFVSVLVEGAGDSFTIVVLDSFFSAGGFVTVVSFCSQAESNAAPAKRQMYFFINQLDDEFSVLINKNYGVGAAVGDSAGLVVVVVVVSVEVVPLGLAAGATVSFFCSHAASSAAPVKMQMYFFIIVG